MDFLVGMKRGVVAQKLAGNIGWGLYSGESSRQGGLDGRAVEENMFDSVVGVLAERARGG